MIKYDKLEKENVGLEATCDRLRKENEASNAKIVTQREENDDLIAQNERLDRYVEELKEFENVSIHSITDDEILDEIEEPTTKKQKISQTKKAKVYKCIIMLTPLKLSLWSTHSTGKETCMRAHTPAFSLALASLSYKPISFCMLQINCRFKVPKDLNS